MVSANLRPFQIAYKYKMATNIISRREILTCLHYKRL